jgi:hypothetical protein
MALKYKIQEHSLTSKQKAWLIKLCKHENKDYWLSRQKDEEAKVRKILLKGSYNDKEQQLLINIVDYYKTHVGICGTLNNPRP